ncbi:MAG: hypothetical protein ACREFF_13655 [Candidatus Udaeobacter sp.]
MNTFFVILQLILLLAGVGFAVAWAAHPEGHYDIPLAISVALAALLEFVKRLVKEEPEKKAAEKERQRWLDAINALAAAQKQAQTESTSSPERPAKSAPVAEVDPIAIVVTARQRVESLIREYALATERDSTGSADSVLARVPMDNAFRDGILLFLNKTDDLAHQPGPIIQWAASNGEKYVELLQFLIGNAKRPAPG